VLVVLKPLKSMYGYNYKGRENISFYNIARKCNPVTRISKGWKQDLTGMTTYDELPLN
jgi:adenylosuccinate synthase